MEDDDEKADPALNPTLRKIFVVERKVYVKDNNLDQLWSLPLSSHMLSCDRLLADILSLNDFQLVIFNIKLGSRASDQPSIWNTSFWYSHREWKLLLRPISLPHQIKEKLD